MEEPNIQDEDPAYEGSNEDERYTNVIHPIYEEETIVPSVIPSISPGSVQPPPEGIQAAIQDHGVSLEKVLLITVLILILVCIAAVMIIGPMICLNQFRQYQSSSQQPQSSVQLP